MTKKEYIELRKLLLLRGGEHSLSAITKLLNDNPFLENGNLKEELNLNDEEIKSIENIINDDYIDFMKTVFNNTYETLQKILEKGKTTVYDFLGVEYGASEIIREYGLPIYERVHNLTPFEIIAGHKLFARDYHGASQILVYLGISDTLEISKLIDLNFLVELLNQQNIDIKVDLDNNKLIVVSKKKVLK